VIGNAEFLAMGSDSCFVVTSLIAYQSSAARVCEQDYGTQAEMGNLIKNQQRFLFANRTSCQTMRSNQLRLWMSADNFILLSPVLTTNCLV
jgi:hypothetical protein